MVVLGLVGAQFWRVLVVEGRAREVEIEKAKIAAEQLLRDAVASPQLFALVPNEQRAVLWRVGERWQPDVEPEVGWIDEDRDTEMDAVVADRLDRAARDEFVAQDAAAAQKEYDELLAGSLRAVDRVAVLSAAMWQAQRAGAGERCQQLLQQGEQVVGELLPAAAGVPFVANAIAGVVRLRARVGGAMPVWIGVVVPRLLPEVAAACVEALGGVAGQAALPQRCELVQSRRQVLARLQRGAQAAVEEVPGMEVAGGTGQLLCWWQPRGSGVVEAALVGELDWLGLVRKAGEDGVLPSWPWLVKPTFDFLRGGLDGLGPDPAIGGVPCLSGLVAIDRPLLDQGMLLLPIATVVLLFAFVILLVQQFRAARREAMAAKKQTEFLTTVTHELKTPLASIRLLSELLADGRATGKESEYYGLLAVEASRLGMLIENVLDLGRAERGERAFDLRSLDLGDVVRETLAMFAPLCERDGLRVELHEDVAGATVRGDRSALVQALLNVLDNARKYAAAGQRLEVTVENGSPAQYAVQIRDHGPGIPAGEREAIFDRFARGKAQQHGSIAGVGIGLYLARSIARRHGGELLCVAPADGPGALFVLTLPREEKP